MNPKRPRKCTVAGKALCSSALRLVCAGAIVALSGYQSTMAHGDAKGHVIKPQETTKIPVAIERPDNVAEILATRENTNGVWGVWRFTSAPLDGPPMHIHTDADELFYVLSGEFAVQLEDCVEAAPAGTFIFIAKNVPHTFRNMADGPGELLGAVTPGGFENFFSATATATPEDVGRLMNQHAMHVTGPRIDLDSLRGHLANLDQSAPAGSRRIGLLSPGCSPPSHLLGSLLDGLQDLGYSAGENVSFEWRFSAGDASRFPALASELVDEKVDVIIAMSTPAAIAAKEATTSVPIVMVYVADPQGTGLVASLSQPGGNVTGVTDMATELSAKRLALLKETVPTVSRVGVLWNSADPGMVLRFREIEAAAKEMGLGLISVEIRSHDEFESAFAKLREDPPDALFVVAEVLTIGRRCQIIEFAQTNSLPAIYEFGLFAREGGLLSYGPNLAESFQRGAYFVDQILKGKSPNDLPVEQPKSYEMVVNLDAAKHLGVDVPPAILLQAVQIAGKPENPCAKTW